MKVNVLLFALLASVAHGQEFGDIVGKIDIYKFIESAESLALYSVDPTWPELLPAEKRAETIEKFHGHVVFGKIEGAEVGEKVRAALTAALTHFPSGPYECFDPRHGISLVFGGRTLDVLLCYECRQCCFYFDGVAQYAPLGPRGEAELNALLDERQIKRDVPRRKDTEPNKPAEPTEGTRTDDREIGFSFTLAVSAAHG